MFLSPSPHVRRPEASPSRQKTQSAEISEASSRAAAASTMPDFKLGAEAAASLQQGTAAAASTGMLPNYGAPRAYQGYGMCDFRKQS